VPRLEFLFPALSGGLINGISDDFAPDHGLRVADNVDFGKPPLGGITLRPPNYDRNLAPPDVITAHWLIRFRGYDTDNKPYLFFCDETYTDDQGREISELTARFIDQNLSEMGEPILFEHEQHRSVDRKYAIQDENKVYFVGTIGDPGSHRPTVLEVNSGNLTLRDMGFPPVTIPTITSVTTGGSVDDGQHYYQLILTDANGHRSAPIAIDTFHGRNRITTSGSDSSVVTLGGEADADHLPSCEGEYKYLYRAETGVDITGKNPDNYPVFYLVKVLAGNVVDTTDNISDATLVTHEVLDMSAHTPPWNLANAVIHNGRMWGFEEESSVLRYSEQFDYENWPLLNAIPIGDPDYLAGIASVGDRLLLFKKTKTYAFWGTHIGNYDYREISSIYGTEYPKTIRTLSDTQLIFLDSQERVIMYNGGQFADISKVIRLPESSSYWATVFNDYYILWLYEDEDITGYAYHLPSRAWTKWTGLDVSMPEEPNRPGLDHLVYWSGSSINVLGRDFTGLAKGEYAQAGDLVMRTQNTDCGSPLQEKSFKEVEIFFEPIDPTLSFDGRLGQLEFIKDEGTDLESSFQQHIDYDSDNPSKRQRFRIPNGANGTRGSVRFIGNNNMEYFSLMQVRLRWQARGTPIR